MTVAATRRTAIATAAALALVAAPLAGAARLGGGSAAATTSSQVFAVIADAEVSASQPTTNYGGTKKLHADGSPVKRSYLKFAVSGLSGSVTAAHLQVYALSSQSVGIAAHPVGDNSWSENTVTYANAPAFAAAMGASGRVSSGTWITVDVTGAVTGDGTYSIALDTSSVTNVALASREAGSATAPVLVVDTSAATSTASGAPDTTPPTQPGTPAVTAADATSVKLAWGASTDNVGVAGYGLYANGVAVGSTSQTSYSFTGLACGTSYTLGVDAYDAAGNRSSQSSLTTATSPCPDTTAPTAPSSLAVTSATDTSIALAWTASTDNVGVTRYDVAVDGAKAGSVQTTSYTVGGLSCGTSHTVGVTAYDAAGNASPTTTVTAATTACPPPPPSADVQPSFPIRAAFYYPWYPETWTVGGQYPHYSPSLGYYDSSSASVISAHVAAMQYAKVQVGIASWWGQGTRTDGRFKTLLSTTDQAGSAFRWAVYYEPEGSSDPTVSQITSDLTAIRNNYGADPSYFRVNGRFVVFVYADALDACGMADRWKQANTVNAYIVLKVFSGYRTCINQPDEWHQYSPAVAEDAQPGFSFSISPGFYKANEPSPRLGRDLARWAQNVRDMVASKAPFQLVTTFDEWGEGTAVESANEWASASGYGSYLDVLHDDGQSAGTPPDSTPPSQPTNLTVAAATQTGLSLTWTASSDNVGVTGYTVYVDGAKVASTASTSYSVGGLTCGTAYTVSVEAYDGAGNTSTRAGVAGSTSACSPPASADPVVAAAGDISCDPADGSFNGGNGTSSNCRQKYTANLLVNLNPTAVLTLGDNQYEDNAYAKYVAAGAYDATWGRLRSILYPGIGNHEYLTSGGAGYCQYFGAAAHCDSTGLATNGAYYSFDVGAWHIIALNSECSNAGGCGAGSPQETWLKNDLAAHPSRCVLAYWHEPRWSSGQHGSNSAYAAFWSDLYAAHADVVLNGHDHDYERFAPQNPSGAGDPNGIREFVVGTGGKNHYGFTTVQANSEVRNSDTYGVLKLTLHAAGYDWQFVNDPGSGSFTDSGSGQCS